jgi:hypothetical protein
MRHDDIAKKWEIAASLQEDFHSRYVADGNAHNYPERYNRVLDIYADEMFEVIAKADAISEGLEIVFGVRLPVPKYDDPATGFLDKMVVWARDVARFLHHHNELSSIYDVIAPLVQPWRADPFGPFIVGDEFRRNLKKAGPRKVLTFDFNNTLFGQTAVRVIGVGLSFGFHVPANTPGWRDEASGYRLRTTIHTPPQKMVNGEFYERPPVLLGNVALHAADAPVAWHDGYVCRNINPQGKWRIVVEERLAFFDGKEHDVSKGFWSPEIPDIKLHLRIKAEVDPSVDSGFSK